MSEITNTNDQLAERLEKRTEADWDMCFKGENPKPTFLWDGFLAGSVGALIAAGGVGKSYLGLGLGISLTAKDMLQFNAMSENNKVVYLTAEDPLVILEDRMSHFGEHLSPTEREKVIKNFSVQSIHGYSPELLNIKGERNEIWINALKHLATGKTLLMLDTLRKFHKAEENDSGHMTHVTQILDEIASETGCAILFLHHANKLATLSGQGGNQGASRGSSALVDNIRYQINLSVMTSAEAEKLGVDNDMRQKFVKLESSKANYAENSGDWWFRRTKGGVLVKAVFDTPYQVKQTKERKAAFKEELAQQAEPVQKVIDPSDPDSVSGMSYKDIFG